MKTERFKKNRRKTYGVVSFSSDGEFCPFSVSFVKTTMTFDLKIK